MRGRQARARSSGLCLEPTKAPQLHFSSCLCLPAPECPWTLCLRFLSIKQGWHQSLSTVLCQEDKPIDDYKVFG